MLLCVCVGDVVCVLLLLCVCVVVVAYSASDLNVHWPGVYYIVD